MLTTNGYSWPINTYLHTDKYTWNYIRQYQSFIASIVRFEKAFYIQYAFFENIFPSHEIFSSIQLYEIWRTSLDISMSDFVMEFWRGKYHINRQAEAIHLIHFTLLYTYICMCVCVFIVQWTWIHHYCIKQWILILSSIGLSIAMKSEPNDMHIIA